MDAHRSPKVGTVMCNRDQFDLTANCLRSLQRLTYPNHEIIVVDNGSRDGSPERIRTEFPEATLVESKESLRYCRGYNLGMKEALRNGADYVFILNNDTKDFSENYLEEIVKAFESDKKVGAVGSVVEDYDGNIRASGDVRTKLGVDTELAGEGFFVRSQVLKEVGLFDEAMVMYFEDLDLTVRLRKAGYKTMAVRTVKFAHLGGAAMSRLPFDRHYLRVRNLFLFVRRHCGHKSLDWQRRTLLHNLRSHRRLLQERLQDTDIGGSLATILGVLLGLVTGGLIYAGIIRKEPRYGLPTVK